MSARQRKVPVTVRALVQRINRALASDGKRLRGTRGRGPGVYYVVSGSRVTQSAVNLEALGRKLGVLYAWETLKGGKDA